MIQPATLISITPYAINQGIQALDGVYEYSPHGWTERKLQELGKSSEPGKELSLDVFVLKLREALDFTYPWKLKNTAEKVDVVAVGCFFISKLDFFIRDIEVDAKQQFRQTPSFIEKNHEFLARDTGPEKVPQGVILPIFPRSNLVLISVGQEKVNAAIKELQDTFDFSATDWVLRKLGDIGKSCEPFCELSLDALASNLRMALDYSPQWFVKGSKEQKDVVEVGLFFIPKLGLAKEHEDPVMQKFRETPSFKERNKEFIGDLDAEAELFCLFEG